MKKKIQKINCLLIEHFGIPERPKRLPDPLDIIIGTILSQNTNDKNSYKAFLNLKKSIKHWDELLQMKPSQVEKLIKVAGLGKQKSSAIINLIKNLKEKNGKVNLSHIKKMNDGEIIEELTSHKGIGVKTASCVLLFALNRNVCPVDTHVHRILNRVGIVKTSTPEKTFYKIEKYIPENSAHSFHTNLLRLGREYCTPTNPKCYDCPIESECNYAEKNFTSKKPIKKNDFFLLDSIK
ncbi:endonuclease III [Ignavibacterium sp.]|uniref:endonuclease III domain-containing protein n=1 Tax=Ignavibacterium sp. TaxID=2651167 RepID=UPI00307DE2E5